MNSSMIVNRSLEKIPYSQLTGTHLMSRKLTDVGAASRMRSQWVYSRDWWVPLHEKMLAGFTESQKLEPLHISLFRLHRTRMLCWYFGDRKSRTEECEEDQTWTMFTIQLFKRMSERLAVSGVLEGRRRTTSWQSTGVSVLNGSRPLGNCGVLKREEKRWTDSWGMDYLCIRRRPFPEYIVRRTRVDTQSEIKEID